MVMRIENSDYEALSHRDLVRFILFCTYQVKKRWEDVPEHVRAVELAELWLEGKATTKECYDACEISAIIYSKNGTIPPSAVYPALAASATSDHIERIIGYAFHANICSAPDSISVQERWDYFYELKNFDQIAEQILLGE